MRIHPLREVRELPQTKLPHGVPDIASPGSESAES
jgi:hypothetical protein